MKLELQNIHIWDGHSSRNYLDRIGLSTHKGNVIYYFNAPYTDFNETYKG